MKLHNVDSQSRSSGVGALDNSAISTSHVVLSENFHVLHSSARQYLGVGAMQAANIAPSVGHSPSPLASSGDDQLRVPGHGRRLLLPLCLLLRFSFLLLPRFLCLLPLLPYLPLLLFVFSPPW